MIDFKLKKKILILGAGPCGLALGVQLLKKNNYLEVTIVDKNQFVGGLAGSFKYSDIYFDNGSHRLHSSTRQDILNDIKKLLGEDLIKRKRSGRIRIFCKFFNFPLNLIELIIKLPLKFSFGIFFDKISSLNFKSKIITPTFEDYLLNKLGKSMSENFYFPYAKKLWGLNPNQISEIQAHKRISTNSITKIIKKYFFTLKKTKNFFYYPNQGFGQISNSLKKEFIKLGGNLHLNFDISSINVSKENEIKIISKKQDIILKGDFVFSTIPITTLIKIVNNNKNNINFKTPSLKYRSMILVYFILNKQSFTKYDAHYFPSDDVIFTRISEPKNYSGVNNPKGKTGICVEIPCDKNESIWNFNDADIINKVIYDLEKINLNIKQFIIESFIKKIDFVYPIYDLKYENTLNHYNKKIDSFTNIISIGRQALFAHDNTHHTIEMAYSAADCIDNNLHWNYKKWEAYKKKFDTNVVED